MIEESRQLLEQSTALLLNASSIQAQLQQRILGSDKAQSIDDACGYPRELTIEDYKQIYEREGIGTRIVDILPEESWKENPEVIEKEDGDFTEWEQAWNDLEDEFSIYAEMINADQISGIGTFGIIMLGIDDNLDPIQAASGIDPFTGEIKEGERAERKLIYLRSFDASVVQVGTFQVDPKSPRFGQPLTYKINMSSEPLSDKAGQMSPENKSLEVHWTRCIHIADNCKNSKVFGTPRLKKCFDRVRDLKKVLGGSGEMFWKGGFPGIAFETQPTTQGMETASMSASDRKKFRAEIARYSRGLQRTLTLVGMTAKSLAVQVADPSKHFETSIKAICISEGIPYRVFMGSEEAQLAGAQDKQAWNEKLKGRQKNYMIPRIIRPFVQRLMALGVLKFTAKFMVKFPDLNTPSALDKSNVAVNQTKALAQYIMSGVDQLVQPMEYLTLVMGYDTDTAMSILENALIADDGTIEPPPIQVDPNKAPPVPPTNGGPTGGNKFSVKNIQREETIKLVTNMIARGGAYRKATQS